MQQRGLENATIHVGGDFWRGLGRNGALIIGYALVAIHVAIVAIRALWVPDMSFRAQDRWDSAYLLSTVLAPLLAMCFLIIGELIRRGDWNKENRRAGKFRKEGDDLPQVSNTVHLRMVPLSWHVLWGVISLVAALLLLWLAWDDPWSDQATIGPVNGTIAAGTFGAIVASGLKKFHWYRWGLARQQALAEEWDASGGTPGDTRLAKFWRSVGFRWRFDLWCVGLGTVVLWFAGWAWVTRDIYAGSTESATLFAYIAWGVGGLMVAWGLWATTQFWRSGEDLAGAESVA